MRRGRIRIAALAALALTAVPGTAASGTTASQAAPAGVVREAALAAGPPALRANGRVNVRAEPSRTAPVVATVTPGTVLESPGIVSGRPWVAVSRDGKLFGYVFAELVSAVAPALPSAPESAVPAVVAPAADPPAAGTIDDRLREVEQAVSGMRAELDQQARQSREGFERTGRLLSDIQARLPDLDGPAVVRLHPPPTRLDVAIASVRGLIARIVGD